MSDSLWPHGLGVHSPGQNTGVGSRLLLQGIFPTQGSNPGLPPCKQTLYPPSHQWQPTPVPLPRKSHGRRSLVFMGSQRVRRDWATSLSLSLQLHFMKSVLQPSLPVKQQLPSYQKTLVIPPTPVQHHRICWSLLFPTPPARILAPARLNVSAYLWSPLVVVQSLTLFRLFATPWTAAHQASLSFTISQSLLKLVSIELVMSPNHLILCRPLFLLPSIFPSIKVFSNESATSGGQSTGALASASVLPMNIQDWFSLGSHGLKHARLPWPSPTPRAYSTSCPSGWWSHSTISSSVVSFSSCLQSFPASGSFLPIRWPKYWSFSFSISPSNEYSGLTSFRIEWFDLLAIQGNLKSLLQYHSSKAKSISCSALSSLYSPTHTFIHNYWKNHTLD